MDRLDSINQFTTLFADEVPKERYLRDRFHASFGDSSFSAAEVTHFVNSAKAHITTGKAAEIFSRVISSGLAKRLFQECERDASTELLRAYVTMRYCADEGLDSRQIFEHMQEAEIKSDQLCYKFAAHVGKHDPAGLVDEVGVLKLQDPALNRRLAEIALNFDPKAFLENLSGFNFFDDAVRGEYYLKGLIRSTEVAEQLADDIWFTDRIRQLPDSVLEQLYSDFHFGQKAIQESGLAADIWFIDRTRELELPDFVLEQVYTDFYFGQKAIQESDLAAARQMTEAEIFRRLLTDRAFVDFLSRREVAFPNARQFLFLLDDTDKLPLLAMLLLLTAVKNPQEAIQSPEIQAFLQEIKSFPSPSVRFAAVTLLSALVKKQADLLSLQYAFDGKSDYPKILSLVVYVCDQLCPAANARGVLLNKWKEKTFRAEFTCFLAELMVGEKIDEACRQNVLEHFFQTRDLQRPEVLIQYTSCLRRRLVKQLGLKVHPNIILSERFQAALDSLGSPYKCSLTVEELSKLQYKDEIGHYVQALQRLPADDKQRMVPFFFRFLRLTAAGEMQEERYRTPEIRALFKKFKLDLSRWKQERSSTVAEIFARFPDIPSIVPRPLDIKSEMRTAFEDGHLLQADYPKVYAYIFNNAKSPILDGAKFGLLAKQKTDKAKKRCTSDRLARLYASTDTHDQIRLLQQLTNTFSMATDFGVDIKNWKNALNAFHQKSKAGYLAHQVIISDDPYLLFRIGSMAGSSCQRVTGDPAKNKCLLAYPCDGKNKAVFVQDLKGEVIGRAILRFFYAGTMLDEPDAPLEPGAEWLSPDFDVLAIDWESAYNKQTRMEEPSRTCLNAQRGPVSLETEYTGPEPYFGVSHPVLYLESFYPAGVADELRQAMTLSAIECARELGVPLVRLYKKQEKQEDDPDYPFILKTINGPAPYEYYDGTDSKIKQNDPHEGNTHFMDWIEGSKVKVLYDPSEEAVRPDSSSG